MIHVTVLKNQNGKYIGFNCIGHAGFADAGKDIVCAGVSSLVINTVNSISVLTKERFDMDTDEICGRISLRFCGPCGHDAGLLMESMILGLQGIKKQYGSGYITLDFKEV